MQILITKILSHGSFQKRCGLGFYIEVYDLFCVRFIYVWGMGQSSFFLIYACPIVPASFVEKIVLSPPNLSKLNWPCICVSLFADSALFHWSICLGQAITHVSWRLKIQRQKVLCANEKGPGMYQTSLMFAYVFFLLLYVFFLLLYCIQCLYQSLR